MILEHPLDADGVGVENFLVRFEQENNVAVGPVVFLFVADHDGYKCRGHEFVVTGTAGVFRYREI